MCCYRTHSEPVFGLPRSFRPGRAVEQRSVRADQLTAHAPSRQSGQSDGGRGRKPGRLGSPIDR
jgi:hypothetical protein